jgi:hypothetical protein
LISVKRCKETFNKEANMNIFSYRSSILDRNSPHPELMERMMARIAVKSITAARVDGGMAWYEARTKCIFCRHEQECRDWLQGSQGSSSPKFCPNLELFRRCAETDPRDQRALPRVAA